MTEPVWLTYREAAARVGRKTRAIRYWRARGMPMEWATREGQRVRVVDETVLLAWWRQRLANWPPHQYRMRRLRAEREAATRPNETGA